MAVALQSPQLPRLSDPFSVFSQRLGAPLRTAAADGCVVRQYRSGAGTLTVAFDRGRGLAVRLPAGVREISQVDAMALLAMFAPANGPQPRLLIDDKGLLIAEWNCSDAIVELLRGFADAVGSDEPD